MEGRTLNCEETEELLPGYVLGALSAGETARMAHHLVTCPNHAASLDQYQAVCDSLCASVPVVEPPAHLKTRLLTRVAARSGAPRRTDRIARLSWAVAALAAVLAIAFGAWGFTLQGRINDQAARRDQLSAIALRPDSRMVPLETAPTGGSAKGVLIYAGSQAAVWVVGLPPLEGEQVYQCWWIDTSNHRVSGGTFRPEGGVSTWLIPMPDDPQNYHAIGITLEPNAESVEPQGPRVLGGEF